MEPVTLVTTALAAGARLGLKDAPSSAVTDAYAILKSLARGKLAGRQDGRLVLDRHEHAPHTWEGPLAAELGAAGASTDTHLVAAAQALMTLIDPAGSQTGKYTVTVRGSQGVQIGDGNSQHYTYIHASPPVANSQAPAYDERFTTAAARLAEADPGSRIIGAHDMARLADDWEARRQECIDMLCTSLRINLLPEGRTGHASPAREAHYTLIRLITAHLQPDSKRAYAHADWSNCNFDFTGVIFDSADFAGACFNGTVKFRDTEFIAGTTSFRNAQFAGNGNVDFTCARFNSCVTFGSALFGGDSRTDFVGAQFNGELIDFEHAEFSGGSVVFSSAKFIGGTVSFNDAQFAGSTVVFAVGQFTGGTVLFCRARFTDGIVDFTCTNLDKGVVNFWDAQFSGGSLNFIVTQFRGTEVAFRAAQFKGGAVHFQAQITGGVISFDHAQFTGSAIMFDEAGLKGGIADFSKVGDWTKPPVFSRPIPSAPGLRMP